MKQLALILLLLFPQGPAFGLSEPEQQIVSDQPGGPWQGVVADPVGKTPLQSWALRTGFRKGVLDQSLPEEIEAGPDIAVLRNGQHAAWPGLLAEFQEASVAVEPDAVAGRSRQQPVLVVPSGGLEGLAASRFFTAGLAEYVRSGGILLCMAQKRGADLHALPSEMSGVIDGAGWAEDKGPLFRRSALKLRHPATAALEKTIPSLETGGYLKTLPENALVLLLRQDGRPTLALYPFGKGWVALTTLLSDFYHTQGFLSADEKTLLRGLLLWGKSGGRVREISPGAELSAPLRIRGLLSGSATRISVRAAEPGQNGTKNERLFPLSVPEQGEAVLSYSHTLPRDIGPGIYNLEYVLLDDKNQPLTHPAESGDGWFSVMPSAPLPSPPPQPLSSPSVEFSVQPGLEQAGNTTNLNLAITRTGGQAGAYDVIVRTANQEKNVTLTGDRNVVSFHNVQAEADRPVPYALDHAGGGAIARGAIARKAAAGPGVGIERRLYLPGQAVRVSVNGMGLGAFSLAGLGTSFDEHISVDKGYALPVPEGLPEGLYPVTWAFQTRAGDRQEGTIHVMVRGARVRCENISWTAAPDSGNAAVLRLESSRRIDATVRLRLERSDGTVLQSLDHAASLLAGMNVLSIPVVFRPDSGGIVNLRYEVVSSPPEGPGYSLEPMLLDTGRLFIDAGAFAVLGIASDPLVSYLPRGAMRFEATIFAGAKARAELSLDGKRVKKADLAPGTATVSYEAKKLSQGPHRFGATASGEGPASGSEKRFLFGARLPDLAVSIMTSGLKAPAIEIGVGVVNRGKVASAPAHAALYEGDPSRGGVKIFSFPVPPLAPSAQHVVVAPWPLGGKAGPRAITAVVDEEQAIKETSRDNNTARIPLDIPEILLAVASQQDSYAADADAAYQVMVANFTAGTIPLMTVNIQVTAPDGTSAISEQVPVRNLESGGIERIERVLGPGIPRPGIYAVAAQVTDGSRHASETGMVTIRPTLSVRGSLAGTPAVAAPCKPLEIRYAVKNAGNVPVSGGSLKIEIRSKTSNLLVHAIQLPFLIGERVHRINKMEFPREEYAVTLRASVANQPLGMNEDLLLEERTLSVRGPVDLSLAPAALPRLLVWTGGESEASIERALSEKMLREAFERDSIYTKIVSSAEDFTREALSGVFNAFLLIDIDTTLDAADTLAAALARGHGVIISGSADRTRSLAEQFGFRFEPTDSGGISFAADSPLGLTGTLPVGKPALIASRAGSRTLATYDNGKPALLLAQEGGGRILAIPFSLVRSSLAAGTSSLYSLLIRSAVFAAAPEREDSGLSTVRMVLSSPSGPVKSRISIPLAGSDKMLWANRSSATTADSAVFDLVADRTAQTILFLVKSGKTAVDPNAIEVRYECDGAYVVQENRE